VTPGDAARISWARNLEDRYPYGPLSPDPDRFEPIGLPPPWPTRPWIYGNVIASANGILAWRRQRPDDDPVRAIAGGDFSRPGRKADTRLLRYLRTCADAVSIGAQTLRDQPDLILTPGNIAREPAQAFYRFRATHGLRPVPLQVVYSQRGLLDLDVPLFNTPGLQVIVVTTAAGARLLRLRGSEAKGVTLLEAGEDIVDSAGLIKAHERLFDEHGVRYLDCEGGAIVLGALHRAGILDELFVSVTEVHVEPSEHDAVKRVFAFEAEGASLVAEGRTDSDAGYVFRRWRFNKR
jgi:riboflavin biosynthesis pyrimidine reductase